MAAAGVGLALHGISSLLGSLLGGMAKRKAQATNENQAENVAVQGWDSDLAAIASAYNNGTVNAAEAQQAVMQAWQNFWNVVTPHIQPNRNGCNSGSNCPHLASSPNYEPANYCSGNIGGSCCIGCGSIQKSRDNFLAVLQAGSGTVQVLKVYGNPKYGSNDREAYTITLGYQSTPSGAVQAAVNSLNFQNSSGVSTSFPGVTGGFESALGLSTNPTGGLQVTPTFVLIVIAVLGLFVSLGFVTGRK